MYKNPKVINELGGIVMEAVQEGEPDQYLDPVLDADEHNAVTAGKYGAVAPFTPPSEAEVLEELAAAARAQRDSLLASTDWTQLPDVPQATREAYAVYRQALRDVPEQEGFPTDINWPTL